MRATALIRPGLAALGLLTTVLLTSNASAVPIAVPQADRAATVEQARWVCGRFGHCWWRPNFCAQRRRALALRRRCLSRRTSHTRRLVRSDHS
jgi:hypothetical protein